MFTLRQILIIFQTVIKYLCHRTAAKVKAVSFSSLSCLSFKCRQNVQHHSTNQAVFLGLGCLQSCPKIPSVSRLIFISTRTCAKASSGTTMHLKLLLMEGQHDLADFLPIKNFSQSCKNNEDVKKREKMMCLTTPQH